MKLRAIASLPLAAVTLLAMAGCSDDQSKDDTAKPTEQVTQQEKPADQATDPAEPTTQEPVEPAEPTDAVTSDAPVDPGEEGDDDTDLGDSNVNQGTFTATIDGQPFTLNDGKVMCSISDTETAIVASDGDKGLAATFGSDGELQALTMGATPGGQLAYSGGTGTITKSVAEGKHFEAEGSAPFVDTDNPTQVQEKPFTLVVDCE